MNAQPELDDSELLSLAMEASSRAKYDDAITLLKRLVARNPQHARAHYLLGSIYAQIAMFDRAEASMAEALRLEPELAPARFQLGLLYVTSYRPVEAEQTWAALDQLAEDDPLRLFKEGLLQLAKDEFAAATSLIERGLERNKAFPSLNTDMQKVLARIREHGGEKTGAADKPRHVFLGQYGAGANDTSDE
jgi:tetratricopeptide (TPR) repeat protein